MKTKALAAALAVVGAAAVATQASGSQEGGRSASSAQTADLAARGTAGGDVDKYTGSFRGAEQRGSKIVIKAAMQGGEATEVKRMRYTALMDCQESGKVAGSAGWRFRGGIPVGPDRRFRVRGDDDASPRSTLRFKGRFSPSFQRVRGTFRTRQWFEAEGTLPAEYCRLERTRYRAR